MADDRDRIVISSGLGLTPEEVVDRSFSTSFRGFDQGDVRRFLQRVADELRAAAERQREMHRQLEDARERAAHPDLDEGEMTAVLGEQTTRILHSAREAAAEIKGKAEEAAARTLREAQEQSARLRADAESLLARRVEEADEVAGEIRRGAETQAATVRSSAQAEADAELDAARTRGREMVAEAQAVRERVLGDLARRRRLAHVQI